jgi:hypothetical protein
VKGPVTADAHHEPPTCLGGLARELRRVPRALGDRDVVRDAALAEGRSDLVEGR